MSTAMECWWWLMMIIAAILLFRSTEGGCIQDERKALLDIKFSLLNLSIFDEFDVKREDFLPSWIDYECCDWERVKCNTTTGHVTEISFYNVNNIPSKTERFTIAVDWPLNVSMFLHFQELSSLNLSSNHLEVDILNSELKRLASLKKLESLDLSSNDHIDNGILPSLRTLTSLKSLYLSGTSLEGDFPANGKLISQCFSYLILVIICSRMQALKIFEPFLPIYIADFAALENLEMLDVSGCHFRGTFQIQGFEMVSVFRKLEILNLGLNNFNDSLITSLSILPSLKALDLYGNPLSPSFPAQELSLLINLQKLDLGYINFNGTLNIQACKSLSRLKRLESIALVNSNLNKHIISCLSALPSLKILDLTSSTSSDSSFPVQEFHNLPHLEVLLLGSIGFSGTLPMEAFSSFNYLEVLDLSYNSFVGSIPFAIYTLSSLRAVSFGGNHLSGSLPDRGFCELKNLEELDLSNNMFVGVLPQCFNNLSSLKLFDISSNQFTGILAPSLIANLTSLEYIDFSHNKFEGSFSFSCFSNHTKLEVVGFRSDNDKFEVETEEPIDWIPMFQLKVVVLSNCNMNKRKGRVVPRFLLHQHKLRVVEMSHNSLEGQFPNWLLKNNMNMEVLNLRNNSLGGKFCMPPYRNVDMRWLDMSGNHIISNVPNNIQKLIPYISELNLSRNAFSGAIPSGIGDLTLRILDLSHNEFSGEVPKGLLTSDVKILKLSNNRLHGEVLSGNISLGGNIHALHLDSNCFSGKIAIEADEYLSVYLLDISNNSFEGMIPGWISNMEWLSQLVVRNNNFQGPFPCGRAPFSFLDISQNSFSGPIPTCLNFQDLKNLHLSSNRFTGSIPNYFRNLTNVLTLDIGNNSLSGNIPEFLGGLSNLRILLLRKNNFSGSIPKQLCQLSNMSLLDLSDNSLSGSIPSCLQNITSSSYLDFIQTIILSYPSGSSYQYWSILGGRQGIIIRDESFGSQDEVEITTKSLSLTYKGDILDYMAGLDLSSNKLSGKIPEELGLLIKIRVLNLSHNQLTGSIPMTFSNLENIESMDLSSNGLTRNVPSELIQLKFLSDFNVSHNNLSGRLPPFTGQFGTFSEASYEGNPLLCGPPLEKKCTTTNSQVVINSSVEKDNEKWYDIDITCFYGSSSSTFVVFLLGFVALLYVNPYWRRRWLDYVENCMFTCYYVLYDLVMKPSMIFHK